VQQEHVVRLSAVGRFAAGLILGLLLGALVAAGAWNLLNVSVAPGRGLLVVAVVTVTAVAGLVGRVATRLVGG
jgi:hypothetical protein